MLIRTLVIGLSLSGCAAQCGRLRVYAPDRPMMVGGVARITADRCVPLGKGTFDCDSPQLVEIETNGSDAFRFDLTYNGDDNTFAIAEGRTDATLHFNTGDVVAVTLVARDVDHVELDDRCPGEPARLVSAGLELQTSVSLFGDGEALTGLIDESRFVTIDRGTVWKPDPRGLLHFAFPSTAGPASVRSSLGELLLPVEIFEPDDISGLTVAAEAGPWRVGELLRLGATLQVGARAPCLEDQRRKVVVETPETCSAGHRAERTFTGNSTGLVGVAPGECRAVVSLDDGRFATRVTLTVQPAGG